jgi:hypothetical protein
MKLKNAQLLIIVGLLMLRIEEIDSESNAYLCILKMKVQLLGGTIKTGRNPHLRIMNSMENIVKAD